MAEITYFKMLLFMSFLLSVSGADSEVICVYRESCMLSCQFQIGSEPLIHWYKVSARDSLVHSYYKNQDQLEHQDQNFKDRTSLFQDQISRGNASLLMKVKLQDEGRYKCYTSTTNGFKESFVNLKIEAPVSKVSISQEENRIICSSEGIYPQPELTWSTIPPSNTALNITTTVQQNEEQLYSISSSLMVSDNNTDVSYSCTVSTQRNSMTATLSKPAPSKQSEALSWKLIAGLIAATVVAGIIGVVINKNCKGRSGSKPASVQNVKQPSKETMSLQAKGNEDQDDDSEN